MKSIALVRVLGLCVLAAAIAVIAVATKMLVDPEPSSGSSAMLISAIGVLLVLLVVTLLARRNARRFGDND